MRLHWQTDGVVWQWTGLESRMTMDRNAVGVMADIPALLPLVGNNSRFDYSNANAYIYTNYMTVDLHQPFLLPT